MSTETDELSPLDALRLAVTQPLPLAFVAGEIEDRPRRCPRSAEPTWQIPRRFSALEALRRVFSTRR